MPPGVAGKGRGEVSGSLVVSPNTADAVLPEESRLLPPSGSGCAESSEEPSLDSLLVEADVVAGARRRIRLLLRASSALFRRLERLPSESLSLLSPCNMLAARSAMSSPLDCEFCGVSSLGVAAGSAVVVLSLSWPSFTIIPGTCCPEASRT